MNFFRFKEHINIKIYPRLNTIQENIVPIANRSVFSSHLRDKSIPNLLFD